MTALRCRLPLFDRPASRSAASWAVRASCFAPPPPQPGGTAACLATATTTRRARKSAKAASKAPGKGNGDGTAAGARLPPQLDLASLRDLAVLCGRNSSGTKSALRADLEAALDGTVAGAGADAGAAAAAETAPATTATARRILSIDMGVRNLAYCLLQEDAPPARPQDGGASAPTLVAWERLSLIGGDKHGGLAAGAAAAAAQEQAPPPSAFAPPAMAAVAARLLHERLLPLAPTHVLIERQRFRSGGAAAVLEWTVRVNSLEAMLHGILAYRQLTGVGGSAARPVRSVQAVSPQRVSQFLLRGGLGRCGDPGQGQDPVAPAPAKAKATKERDIKDVKEAFVAGALRASRSSRRPWLLAAAGDTAAGSTAEAFLRRWDAKQKGKGGARPRTRRPAAAAAAASPSVVLSKIDDLADCVVQGLVWLEWERNTARLREQGAAALLATAPPLASR